MYAFGFGRFPRAGKARTWMTMSPLRRSLYPLRIMMSRGLSDGRGPELAATASAGCKKASGSGRDRDCVTFRREMRPRHERQKLTSAERKQRQKGECGSLASNFGAFPPSSRRRSMFQHMMGPQCHSRRRSRNIICCREGARNGGGEEMGVKSDSYV